MSSNVSPGSVIAGCGNLIEGWTGKLRLTLRLEPPADGPVSLCVCAMMQLVNEVGARLDLAQFAAGVDRGVLEEPFPLIGRELFHRIRVVTSGS